MGTLEKELITNRKVSKGGGEQSAEEKNVWPGNGGKGTWLRKKNTEKNFKWVKARELKRNCTKASRAKSHAQEFRYPTRPHVQGNSENSSWISESPTGITAGGVNELRDQGLEEQEETLEAPAD